MKKINIIGCGNVGRTLARLWRDRNIAFIGEILNRSRESAGRAVDFVGQGTPIVSYNEFQSANLFLLGVPDDEIEKCTEKLYETKIDFRGTIVFHCSGSLSSEILNPLKEKGAFVASVHPIQSFADPQIAVKTFAGTYCAFEGDPEAREVLTDLFSQIGGNLILVDSQFKTIYHAGAVFVCNYLVTLMDVGIRCYEKAGIDPKTALKIIEPMVRATIENVFTLGPANALTGPISRGDAGVLQRQIDALKSWNNELATLYKTLGKFTVNLSTQPPESEEKLNRLFDPQR